MQESKQRDGGGGRGGSELKIPEIIERSGVSETSTRRILSQFRHYFPSRRRGKSRVFEPGTVELLKRIKGFYEAGKSTQEIEEILSGSVPQTIDVLPGIPSRPEALPALEERLVSAMEKIIDQRREIAEINEKMIRLEEGTRKAIKEAIDRERKANQGKLEALEAELKNIQEKISERQPGPWEKLRGWILSLFGETNQGEGEKKE